MIKKKDFVELEYTGKLKEEGLVFDTTDKELAKKSGIFQEHERYGTVVVCVGEGHLLKGLDLDLEGKDTNKPYTVELQPEVAFGKKDAKLLKIVPSNVFRQNKVNPVPGLQVNIDGMMGTIKTVNGGRTVVDFNHPFSSKALVYDYKINKILKDDLEKVKSFLIMAFNAKPEGFDLKLENKKLEIKTKTGINLDENAKNLVAEKLKNLLENVDEIIFIEDKKD